MSFNDLRRRIENYIHFYNNDRIKVKLNGLSPVNYRKQATQSRIITIQNSNFWESHQKLEPHARFLFLTLTVKNVYDGKELNDCLSKMTKDFSKLLKKIRKKL
ncbi:IS3 family transposase [Dolosigranulum pigrum]|uniref:IS3 family transposase n=1 Tax=Dolosigranulum pigrum TaxID=29394 RepID=UPI00098BD149|nr:IS3 family transposase [Dolosigranulum pigrum]